MADHAYNNLNLKNIALFPVEDAWSLLIAESFQNEFEKLGGKIVLNEKLQPDQKDFRTFISKAKQAPADGIYTPLLPTQGGVFLKQSKQLSFNGKIMMGDSFGNDDLNAAGSSAEGLYITNLYTDNTKNLITKYKEKFGQDPADPVFVSFGYDGMKSLITAIQISQKQKTSVSNALRKTKLNGTDAEINFSGNQFSEKQERIYRVTNGKLEEVIK
jgi:branched-chain amino acid transport system substrate-binding protein